MGFNLYMICTASVLLLILIATSVYVIKNMTNPDSEISEQDQIQLFMYTETHPHLRLAYTRANADGIITKAESDEIMERIKTAMHRGVPSPQ